MTKQKRIDKAKIICDTYSTDTYTIESCCQNEKIAYETFYLWINKYEEVKNLYKKAQDIKRKANNATLVRLARTALMKKLSFFEYDEVTTETTSNLVTKTKTVTKRIIPNAADIGLALNNLDLDFKQIGENENPDDIADMFEQIAKQMRKSDKGGQDDKI